MHHCLILSPQAQTVPSFDFIGCQKSRVFLSGHRKKCLGTDDLKEGMLPSCLSNSNLRRSSLTNTPRPFQPHLEATAMTGGTKKHAFPCVDGEKPGCLPVQWRSKSPPSLFRHLRASFPPEIRQVGVAHLLRHRGATRGLSILALIPQLPGGPTVSSNSCLGLPSVYQELDMAAAATTCQSWERLLPSPGQRFHFSKEENEVRRGKATWSQWQFQRPTRHT